VKYYPHATASPTTITAWYNGNSRNPSLNATTSFSVGMASSRTKVVCEPVRATPSEKIRCFATVSGYAVGGAVTWTQSGNGNVTFFSPKCVLAGGSCSVVLSGVASGTIFVHATYSGNAFNGASSGEASVTIRKIGS
jgi:hypothetical protein